MIIEKDNSNRCGIFLYYDKDGVVDKYVTYLLKSLRPHLKHLLVVCNGSVNKDAHEEFDKVADEVLIRENEGFDVGGYREGIFHIGLDKLTEYDETIMFNYTFFGPLYPFSEMFEKMNVMDLDFWGITKHHKVDPDPFMANRYGYLPEHIQSHFLVLRRDFIKSKDYIDFITKFKNPTSYLESICEYESIFTKHFADMGYKWDVYVDTDEYAGYAYCPIMFYLKDMIERKRCPIVKRRSFFTDYHDFLLNTCGESTIEAYDYICQNLDYDINMVWDNLLRLENMTEISRAMHLNYMLPNEESVAMKTGLKCAVFCYVQSISHICNYQEYFEELPKEVTLHMVACEDVLHQLKQLFINQCYIEDVIENNTYRNAFKSMCENASEYDYICMIKISDVEQAQPYSNFDSWQYREWENLIGSKHVINNIIDTFENNERLGCLISPMPNHGDLFSMIGDGWKGRFDDVVNYLKQENILVNIKKEDEPLCPFSGAFWIRSHVVPSLVMTKDVDEDIFYMSVPFMIQNARYYVGTAYSNKYAMIETTNLDYMMREMNKVVFRKYGPNYHKVVVERIINDDIIRNPQLEAVQQNVLSKINIILKKCLPKKMYYWIERTYVKLRGWS